MNAICPGKLVKCIVVVLLVYYVFLIIPASAIGEASTSMYVYIPPGGDKFNHEGVVSHSQTASYLVVTATQDNTSVNITDLDTTIGDPTGNSTAYPVIDTDDYDLSETDVRLNKGQSRTIKVSYIQKGPDKDGTFFHIKSDKPVIALTTTSEGTWQADFVPSINGTSKGYEFFIYLPKDKHSYSSGYDLAVFAYENNTNVTVYDITVNSIGMSLPGTGSESNITTSVNLSLENEKGFAMLSETNPELFFEADSINGTGNGVHAGCTYWVKASKPVTVQSAGTIGRDTKKAKDGGYFIPGYSTNPYRDGTGLASTFIAQLNLINDAAEVYLVNQNTINTSYVNISEWDGSNWNQISGSPFIVNKSELKIINETLYDNCFNEKGLVKINSTDENGNPMDISVFSGSYIEKGERKTGDISAFATGNEGYGGSTYTIFYVPPPGYEPFFDNTRYSHIYIYVHFKNTDIQVQAWNKSEKKWTTLPDGIYNDVDKNIVLDHRVTWDQWKNSPDLDYHRMRVLSSERCTVQVNNWHDNWASYVPGGTPPQFSGDISVKARHLTINAIPIPWIGYTFSITNDAIFDIGSELRDLSVVNSIPNSIDQSKLDWSISSNNWSCDFNSSLIHTCTPITNGTKCTWIKSLNAYKSINVTIYTYTDGSDTVFTFNQSVIDMDETITFNINAQLNKTYYDVTQIKSDIIIIPINAEAVNPYFGTVATRSGISGTIILNYLIPGAIVLY